MDSLIVGTAGHVDHGKTMLIKALTGIDTDRLRIEKERGISIELGFASCSLPGGGSIGIVDVPGHERFIKNMLAGIGGIDLALLVIAADEGVMPQTKEHVDIIELLQIKKGVVALTKADLVDEELLDLARSEVKEYLAATSLKDAPLVEVSSVTGQGLSDLLAAIEQVATNIGIKPAIGPVRLPIDRSFTILGFGTVVTGTLWSGIVRINDGLEILPGGLAARVRSLQVHGKKVGEAYAGQRVAVNIPGVEMGQIERGDVLVQKGAFSASNRLDVRLTLLKNLSKPLLNRSRVRFYLGTAEALCRVVLLDRDELGLGDTAYAQLIMEKHIVAGRGDRFILRSYSPMRTVGGGVVIEPAAPKHKRMCDEVITSLEARAQGDPEQIALEILRADPPRLFTGGEMAKVTGVAPEAIKNALDILVAQKKVYQFRIDQEVHFFSYEAYRHWLEKTTKKLGAYHRDYPLRDGIPREELRSRIFSILSTRQMLALLKIMEEQGMVKLSEQTVTLSDFSPSLKGRRQEILSYIEQEFKNGGLHPPSWNDVILRTNLESNEAQEFLQYCLRLNILVKVAGDLYFHADSIKEARRLLLDAFLPKEPFALGQARDIWQNSRKYALPLLEYFDQCKITRRMGDKRILK